ncbi:MAG TPA: hypothetical protein DIT98_04940 [Verrucomicrobiales bacterium]|nr:hypothetical protein [Verrucomicrobiales bacterium]
MIFNDALLADFQDKILADQEDLVVGPMLRVLVDLDESQSSDGCRLRLLIARCLLTLKRVDDAYEVLEPLFPPGPQDGELLLLFVETLSLLGEIDVAESWLQPLLQLQLPDIELLRTLSVWSMCAEKADLCRRYLNQLGEAPGGQFFMMLVGADLLAAEGDHAGVLKFLENQPRSVASRRRYVLRYAEALQEALRESDAWNLLSQASDIFGCEGLIRKGLIELARQPFQLDYAFDLLEEVSVHDRNDVFYHQQGLLHLYRRDWRQAETCFARASQPLAQSSVSEESFFLLVEVLRIQSRYHQARQLILDRLSLCPDNPSLQFAIAQDDLSSHQWRHGWRGYESRVSMQQRIFAMGLRPNWSGESLAGKRVLVVAEQGLGDSVMVASQLFGLDECNANWLFLCFPRLKPLFVRTFGSERIASDLDASLIHSFDCIIGINSLPGLFGFGPPQRQNPCPPYLVASQSDQDVWAQRLSIECAHPFRVGFAWFGGGESLNRMKRSMELRDFLPLFRVGRVSWVSLQYGGAEVDSQISEFSREHQIQTVVFPGVATDLDGQAALCQSLDLVISVDQTVVHLAGAVGTPVWVLLPTAAEWRYGHKGESMPWYSTMRLFRQQVAMDWSDPVEQAAQALNSLIHGC